MSCYRGKRDVLEKGNHRVLKLTDQILKIVELLKSCWENNRWTFMRCSSVSWQNVELETPFFWEVQEKYLVKKKNFHFAFVDFEKAFDKMPLDVVWWLRRKLDLEEWLFKLVQSVYSNQRIRVSFCVAPPLPLHIFLTPLYPSKQIPCPLPRHLKTKLLPVKTNSPFKKNCH